MSGVFSSAESRMAKLKGNQRLTKWMTMTHSELHRPGMTPEESVILTFSPWLKELRMKGLVWRNPEVTVYPEDLVDREGEVSYDVYVSLDTTPENPIILPEEVEDLPETAPVGLKSRTVWNLTRVNDLNDAIDNWHVADGPVPSEWTQERDELLNSLETE